MLTVLLHAQVLTVSPTNSGYRLTGRSFLVNGILEKEKYEQEQANVSQCLSA